jgi:hypothetical protein
VIEATWLWAVHALAAFRGSMAVRELRARVRMREGGRCLRKEGGGLQGKGRENRCGGVMTRK